MLRPLEQRDIEPLRLLRNRPENRCWFFYSEVISAESQKIWYQKYLAAENDFMFAAVLPADPQTFVGAAAIYDYDPEDHSYEVGRLLLDSRNPACHGLGRELVRCICMIADRQLPGLIKTNCALRAEVYSEQ